MMGRDYVEKLVARATADADIAVIEGVMGLFDGASHDGLEGSTAEIAAWLRAPVILVADVYGVARSLAPVVKGFASFERHVRVAGVIANRCGSVRHGIMLAEALQASHLPPMVAAIPQGALPALPERHLGLVTADARNLPPQTLDALADAFEHYSTVGEIVTMARSAPFLYVEAPERKGIAGRARIGVACDAALHFYYRDVLDALEDRGCVLVPFSPVADGACPVISTPSTWAAATRGDGRGAFVQRPHAGLGKGIRGKRPACLCRVRRAHVPLPGDGDSGRPEAPHGGDPADGDEDAQGAAGPRVCGRDLEGGFPLGPCRGASGATSSTTRASRRTPRAPRAGGPSTACASRMSRPRRGGVPEGEHPGKLRAPAPCEPAEGAGEIHQVLRAARWGKDVVQPRWRRELKLLGISGGPPGHPRYPNSRSLPRRLR